MFNMEEFFYSQFSPAGKIIEKLVEFYVPKKAGQKLSRLVFIPFRLSCKQPLSVRIWMLTTVCVSKKIKNQHCLVGKLTKTLILLAGILMHNSWKIWFFHQEPVTNFPAISRVCIMRIYIFKRYRTKLVKLVNIWIM